VNPGDPLGAQPGSGAGRAQPARPGARAAERSALGLCDDVAELEAREFVRPICERLFGAGALPGPRLRIVLAIDCAAQVSRVAGRASGELAVCDTEAEYFLLCLHAQGDGGWAALLQRGAPGVRVLGGGPGSRAGLLVLQDAELLHAERLAGERRGLASWDDPARVSAALRGSQLVLQRLREMLGACWELLAQRGGPSPDQTLTHRLARLDTELELLASVLQESQCGSGSELEAIAGAQLLASGMAGLVSAVEASARAPLCSAVPLAEAPPAALDAAALFGGGAALEDALIARLAVS